MKMLVDAIPAVLFVPVDEIVIHDDCWPFVPVASSVLIMPQRYELSPNYASMYAHIILIYVNTFS